MSSSGVNCGIYAPRADEMKIRYREPDPEYDPRPYGTVELQLASTEALVWFALDVAHATRTPQQLLAEAEAMERLTEMAAEVAGELRRRHAERTAEAEKAGA